MIRTNFKAAALSDAATGRRPATRYVASRLNHVRSARNAVSPKVSFVWSMAKVKYVTKVDLDFDRTASVPLQQPNLLGKR